MNFLLEILQKDISTVDARIAHLCHEHSVPQKALVRLRKLNVKCDSKIRKLLMEFCVFVSLIVNIVACM